MKSKTETGSSGPEKADPKDVPKAGMKIPGLGANAARLLAWVAVSMVVNVVMIPVTIWALTTKKRRAKKSISDRITDSIDESINNDLKDP